MHIHGSGLSLKIGAHTVAVDAGADIIRAHDVAGAVQGARLADAIFRKTGE